MTPKLGSAVDVPRRQLMAGGLDVPDGGRPILRQESSSSLAVSRNTISKGQNKVQSHNNYIMNINCPEANLKTL